MIAHMMCGLHRLGTFFFFNCDIPQRDFATSIRMLAYQLAMFDTRFGAAILWVAAIHENIAGMPLAFSSQLCCQLIIP